MSTGTEDSSTTFGGSSIDEAALDRAVRKFLPILTMKPWSRGPRFASLDMLELIWMKPRIIAEYHRQRAATCPKS